MTIHINTDYSGISPYGLFILLSIASGITVIFRLCIKRGIPVKKSLLLVALTAPMAVVCAVIFTLIISGGKRIGLASIGAAAGVYLAAILVSLIQPGTGHRNIMLQNCTFALPLMYSIAKLGCLSAGCCHGIRYSGPLSVEYSGTDVSVFPVQALESAVFAAIFISGMVMLRKHDTNSVRKVFITSAAAKCALEFLRDTHTGKFISIEQTVCILAILLCGCPLIYNWHKRSSNI
ncbi:MAG: prolipoprotein diacylglyceryl transferase [Ruminococcus sp.]|nr:prolipoprotein diacylglyceryl transferase [Ruminococcus sp.]